MISDAILTLAAGALGGVLVLLGGRQQRRWEEDRAAEESLSVALTKLLTIPLVFLWDCDVLVELKRHPALSLLRLNESMRLVREDLTEIVDAFTTVCQRGTDEEISTASTLLEACRKLGDIVAETSRDLNIENVRAELSHARLDLLNLARLRTGQKEDVRKALGIEDVAPTAESV